MESLFPFLSAHGSSCKISRYPPIIGGNGETGGGPCDPRQGEVKGLLLFQFEKGRESLV